jgi:hypothetical protein
MVKYRILAALAALATTFGGPAISTGWVHCPQIIKNPQKAFKINNLRVGHQ